MDNKTTKIIGALLLILLASGVVYISFQNTARIRVDNDKSTFYVKMLDDNGTPYGNWLVSGIEYNRLFDGNTLQYRDKNSIHIDTIIDNISNTTTIKRYTTYKNSAQIIDTYYFDGNIKDIELFPVTHKVEVINGSGLFYRYTVDELKDTGDKRKLLNEYVLSFGFRMKVELDNRYNWAWIGWPYGEDSLSAQYKVDSDYEVFNVRLFDPALIYYNITSGTVYEFDGNQGLYNTVIKIDDTHYLNTYQGSGNDGYAVILISDTDSMTVTKGTPYEYAATDAYFSSLAEIDSTHYINIYAGNGYDGYAVVLIVNNATWSISKGTPIEFDGVSGQYPAVLKIDDTHYLVAYMGVDNDGFSFVLTVNLIDWTVTAGTKFEFDTSQGKHNALAKIDDTHYLLNYADYYNYGQAIVLIVNQTDWTVTKGDSYKYDASLGQNNALIKIDSTHYLNVHSGTSYLGTAKILTVNLTDWTITGGSSLIYNPTGSYRTHLSQISNDDFLTISDTNSVSNVQVLHVDTSTLEINVTGSSQLNSSPSLTSRYNGLASIDETYFLNTFGGTDNDGYTTILKIDSQSSGYPDTNFTIWTGSEWIDAYNEYMDFRCTSTQTECEPDNQDIGSSQSIYQVCNNGTTAGTAVYMNMNQTITNITLKCDDDFTYAGALTINTTNQTIHDALEADACINISCWADYSNPTAGGFFDTYAYVVS